MAYDFFNPKTRAINCFLGKKGTLLIAGGCFVPTPEHERAGITRKDFSDYVTPSFLRPTSPVIRRRFLEASGLEVPEDVLKATSRIDEFGGSTSEKDQSKVEFILSDWVDDPMEAGDYRLEESNDGVESVGPGKPPVDHVVNLSEKRATESSQEPKSKEKTEEAHYNPSSEDKTIVLLSRKRRSRNPV